MGSEHALVDGVCVLTAAVGVMQQAGPHAPRHQGAMQRRQHEAGLERRIGGPPHEPSGIQVENDRQITPAVAGRERRNIGSPHTIRRLHRKLACEGMANNRGGVTAVGRDPKPSTPASDQLRSAHQTPHAFVADPHASRPYRAQQPQPAIRLTTVRLRHPSGIVSCASAIARAHGGRRRQAEYPLRVTASARHSTRTGKRPFSP
jgi:hypothetical protein